MFDGSNRPGSAVARFPSRRRGVVARLCLLLTLLPVAAPAAAQEPAPWAETLWNPQAAADDFVLPMPCGGAMAFRWVATPAGDSWLDDLQVYLGRAADEASYNEFARLSHLAGSLSQDGEAAARGYYLGKYEVTEAQWQAVTAGDCAVPDAAGRRAIGKVSWFDALDFTRRWNEWLMAEARESLPPAGESLSYVRLPTEEEWEFAVRGGTAVSESDYRAPLFPMQGPVADYAWVQESQSCRGQPRPIGLLAANPLGLHDVLGNVEEMMLEPYRANRAGRLHGQVGGVVARGGSCILNAGQLRSALRIEYGLFDPYSGEALALPLTGFRVAISAPLAIDAQRIAALRDDWQSAVEARDAAPGADPLEIIDEVAAETGDLVARDQLATALLALRQERSEQNEVERRALQSLILAGTSMGNSFLEEVRKDQQLAGFADTYRQLLAGHPDPQSEKHRQYKDLLDKTLAQRAALADRMAFLGGAYLEVLLQAADDYEATALNQAFDGVVASLDALAVETPGGGGITRAQLLTVAGCFLRQAAFSAARQAEDPALFLEELSAQVIDPGRRTQSGCGR